MKPNGGVPLEFDGTLTEAIGTGAEMSGKIRRFADIPDLLKMDIPPVEWLVSGMIARRTITLWTGTDGTAKTFLAQKLGIAVATGGEFLGRHCRLAQVLYLDYENPVFAVKERLELIAGEALMLNFRVWGTWLEQQPPLIGNELLLSIAKETQPLMIFDPFRYAHGADENDSTEMMAVMQQLRYCAACGAAVIVLHHPAKQEGSTGRGSSVIRGAVDVAFQQELSEETDLITLRCVKNRFGERWMETIKPDFDLGTFEVTESAERSRWRADVQTLREIIEKTPGINQNGIYKQAHINKGRLLSLLRQQENILWYSEKGGVSRQFFPLGPKRGPSPGPMDQAGEAGVGPLVPPLKGGPTDQPLPGGSSWSEAPEPTPVRTDPKTNLRKCFVHGAPESWWLRPDGSEWVCGKCHP
jgi:hypothetical protein